MQRHLSSLLFAVLFHLSHTFYGMQVSKQSSRNPVSVVESEPPLMDHHALREYLQQELAGKNFYYFQNPGNGGDFLIGYGQLLLFRDMGLTYETGRSRHQYQNSLLVFGGGGNMIQIEHEEYKNLALALNTNSDPSLGNKIIILPSTIAGWDSLLAGLSSNVVIFCRDLPSYQHVTETVSSDIRVTLTHDMAFYVGDLDPDMPNIRKTAQSPTQGTGLLLRTDGESRMTASLPSGNRDISIEAVNQIAFHYPTDFEVVKEIAHYVLNSVAEYKEVWTDRLHLCISAALVGVQKAHCMDNNFGKVKAVYDLSIRGKYSNTDFAGNPEALPWAARADGQANLLRSASHEARQAHGGNAMEITGSGVTASKASALQVPSEIEARSLVRAERNIDTNLAATTQRSQSASGIYLGDTATKIKGVQ